MVSVGVKANLAGEEFIFETAQQLEYFFPAGIDQGREKLPRRREEEADIHGRRVQSSGSFIRVYRDNGRGGSRNARFR
jgi:hypothetical protein